MTSYNKPEFVVKAIQGIVNQTHTDFELFLMDDNSNERTDRAVAPFLQDKRIIYHKSQVRDADRAASVRYAALINQALELVTGDYISLLYRCLQCVPP